MASRARRQHRPHFKRLILTDEAILVPHVQNLIWPASFHPASHNMHGKVGFESLIESSNNHEVFYICQLDNVSLFVSLRHLHCNTCVTIATLKENTNSPLH
ncbi:MAG: hypothetical protein [Circular genetic element sp.]|nr:MAG: hypothetical protein [Circular genetic element sp.]